MDQKKCQKEQFDYFGKVRLKCQKNIGKMMLAMTRKEINYFTGDINEQTNFHKTYSTRITYMKQIKGHPTHRNLTLSSPIITSSINLHSPSLTSSGRPNVETISPPKK